MRTPTKLHTTALVTGGIAMLLAAAGDASASDRQAFEAKVRKRAVLTGQPAKGICVCQDGSANHYHLGYLLRGVLQDGNGVEITATCVIPKFDPIDGDLILTAPCITYVPL